MSNLISILKKIGSFIKGGDWSDVAAKAKRLVQDGRVTILYNSPTYVMAHVIGDNGEYEVEISRHDPNSQVIEQWICGCPWAQYAFNRTRKWKKYEGRPCSHVLATYWKARSVPLDIEGIEDFQVPRGQRVAPIGERPGEQAELPGMPRRLPFPIPEQRRFTPEEEALREEEAKKRLEETPPERPLPSTKDIGIGPTPRPKQPSPVTPVRVPQREPMRLFDITSLPTSPPPPPTSPVSIPGGREPTPTNPVQLPGTFSHVAPVVALNVSDFIVTSADELTRYFEEQRRLGKPIYVSLRNPVMLERSGGKIPVPGAVPYDFSKEGIPLYRVMDLGYNPETGRREDANVNALQGAPEWTGQYTEAAANRRGEVLDYDPDLRMAYIVIPLHYEGQDVRLHPHSLRGWVDYRDISPSPGRDPFIRRRR